MASKTIMVADEATSDEIVANTAKETNATHTGEVTGSAALTIDKTAVTGKAAVTAVGADYVLISDADDAGNLKKALISDFASAGGDMSAATYDPDTIAGDVFDMDNMVEGTATKILTADERTKLGTVDSNADVTADNAPKAHLLGSHTTDTLANLNAKVTDATLIDTGDSRLSDDRDPNAHNQAANTITDFDTEVANNSAVAANTAKDSNATHTGEVTGATALTVDKTAVTGKSLVTAVGSDHVLISDADDAGNLKKALISDFASAGGDMAAATYDPLTVAGDAFDMDNMAEGSTAKILTASERTAISTNSAKDTNVDTDLSEGTSTETTVVVESSDGANATLVAASTTRAGLLTKAKFDEIVANTSKVSYTDATKVSGIDEGADVTADNTPKAHTLGSHTTDTLANLNAKVTDATLIDTGDARLSDARTPIAHDLDSHNSCTLAELSSDISDATLIDTGDSRLSDDRDPNAHNQAANTITDFDTEVANNSAVAANTAKDTNVVYPAETPTTVGALIGGADNATPNNTDFVATSLSGAGILKKITWSNVKAFLKTYFDTLYNDYTHPNHTGDVTSVADGATTIGAAKVTEAMQVLADNVTNNVSTAKHGYVPKLSNVTTEFLNGQGAFTTPAGGGGGLTWSLVSTNTNAVVDNGYMINASGGNVTLTLPSSPSEGDSVAICDVYNKATTNVITVGRNSLNIEGSASDLIIDIDGSGMTFVYADATRGWEIVSEVGTSYSIPAITPSEHTPGAAGTATLDLDVSTIHDIAMPAGNITIAMSNEINGNIFTVRILQDSIGSRTVTWFSTIKWSEGSAPTLTTTENKADTFIFRCTGTDTYDGFIVGQNI